MSAIQTGRGKWVVWEPLTNFDGSDATKASYDAWDDDTDYQINDTVSLNSGATLAGYYKARRSHSSNFADRLTGAAGTTPATASNTPPPAKTDKLVANKWREIPQYTVISLRSASLSHGTSQQTATDLSEDQDPSISTELTGQVTLEFNYIEGDKVQDTFRAGASGVCKIYPDGIGAGKRELAFNADVSSVGLNIGSDAMSVPVTLNMDGSLTYGTQ